MDLLEAAVKGDLLQAEQLVSAGVNVDVTDEQGRTPLMWAASGDYLDMVRFLVEHRANIDSRDSDGWTPRRYAAESNNLYVVQLLMEQGATGWIPPLWLTLESDFDMIGFMTEHINTVNNTDNFGWTPLMWAARNGYLNVVLFLVEHGANLNLKSTTGITAHSSVTEFGDQEVVQFLLPFVRYQERRTPTEHLDEQVAGHLNIPFSWVITPFEVEVEPFIVDGNIGEDYRGKWLDADVTIKLFVVDTTRAIFVDKVRLWHQLRHPNVLKLYGVCNSHHHLFVCEYASKKSLSEYLKSCDADRRTPWKFLHEAALGLEYLHERKIVHGNLRGSNILIGSDGLAKLSGFTLTAPSAGGGWYESVDWVRWAAPESLKGEQVSFASDVYSLGMCVIEGVSGKVPLKHWKKTILDKMKMNGQLEKLTSAQMELVVAMCRHDPRERLQIPTIVNKLERFADMEATKLTQHSILSGPGSLVNFDAFNKFNHGETSSLWTAVQTLVAQSENDLYRLMWHELEFIYDTLKANSHLWSTLERFHDLLVECQCCLDAMSEHSLVCRLSLVCPPDHDAETREIEWKRLCREQIKVFVSEASESYVLLGSVNSEEDRSALVTVLRAELRNIDGKYTDEQLVKLQKSYDDIATKS